MTVAVSLEFIDGVKVAVPKSGSPRIVGPGDALVVNGHGARIIPVFRKLVDGYATYEALTADVLQRAGLDGLRALHLYLEQLFARSWIAHRLRHRALPILTIIPVGGAYPLTLRETGSGTPMLSRFALVRRDGAKILLECPVAHARAIVEDPRVLTELWRMADGEAPRQRSGLPAGVVRSIVRMLWSGGFLTTRHPETGIAGDEVAPFVAWEFHDLLFHSRTRRGRHAGPYGATDRLSGRVDLPAAVKPVGSGTELITLARPDLKQLARFDWTLTEALEQRRSHRQFAVRSITRDQLSEFLYRTAGTRHVRGSGAKMAVRRVYPSGGAMYPLEVYVAVRACAGLVPGLYRYCPDGSQLERLSGMNDAVLALVAGAANAGRCESPQVLVAVAARFLRMSWKYSALSYALILKEVGALLQTMYLVATAMELGACAIGGGDADLFAQAAGTSYYEEGAVGELLLGTRADRRVRYSKSLPERSTPANVRGGAPASRRR